MTFHLVRKTSQSAIGFSFSLVITTMVTALALMVQPAWSQQVDEEEIDGSEEIDRSQIEEMIITADPVGLTCPAPL